MSDRPDPDRAELLDALSEAARENSTATVLFHAAVAERAGLGSSDHKALDLLMRKGPLTAGQLGERTGLTAASVTSLIDRLEAQGLVRRQRDEDDRRRVIVHAVIEGQADLARLFEPLRRSVDELLKRYSEAELSIILDFLTRASRVLREQTENMRDR